MNHKKSISMKHALLALLLLGSAGLRGAADDLFPDVNPHGYYGSMIMTAKVTMDGKELAGTKPCTFLGFGYAGLGHEQIDAQAGEENQHKGKEEEHPLIDARNLTGYC